MVKKDYHIKCKPISIKNPQANAILERIHQVIGNMVRTYNLQEIYLDEDNPWGGILSAVAFAVRSTYHTTLHATPGQLVFGRDMILNIKHIADWKAIANIKQILIDKNNSKENIKRINYTYKNGDKVLLYDSEANKYETPYCGPYEVIKAHNNGTVTLKMGAITDIINIRRIIPYKEK